MKPLLVARRCIDSGRHMQLPPALRLFVYVALEHDEAVCSASEAQSLTRELLQEQPSRLRRLFEY